MPFFRMLAMNVVVFLFIFCLLILLQKPRFFKMKMQRRGKCSEVNKKKESKKTLVQLEMWII